MHAVYTCARKEALRGALVGCSTHQRRPEAPQCSATPQLKYARLLKHAQAGFGSSSPWVWLCSASPADAPPSAPLVDGVSAPPAARNTGTRRYQHQLKVRTSPPARCAISATWASNATLARARQTCATHGTGRPTTTRQAAPLILPPCVRDARATCARAETRSAAALLPRLRATRCRASGRGSPGVGRRGGGPTVGGSRRGAIRRGAPGRGRPWPLEELGAAWRRRALELHRALRVWGTAENDAPLACDNTG